MVPILTHSCEVWGYEDNAFIERVHCNFLENVLNLGYVNHFICYTVNQAGIRQQT